MRLAEYTDYTLRVLMYCAGHPDRLVTIAEMADRYEVSRNHLMKIVNDLGRQRVIETVRGRGGGVRLLRRPADIRIGDIVRSSETDFRLAECFDRRTNTCSLIPTCRLKGLLSSALQAYFKELDAATLADIAGPVRTARATVTASPSARNVASMSVVPLTRRRATGKRATMA